jgi:outer membrane scaffolding protein for murein synthesis (MipA/OmpV family)
LEGALGLVASYGPSYSGAEDYRLRIGPAGFLRYGRFTVSGAGGFKTRRDDDVERGVAAEVIDSGDLRLSVSARWSNGRHESNSDRLAGMGDIDGTVLARLRLQWSPDGPWAWTVALSVDALGHGSGAVLDLGMARHWALTPTTLLQFGASVALADSTYLQSWYGVTPEQSARSGYAVYRPGGGLREASAQLTLRTEFDRRWAAYAGTGVSLQLGAAADSPLVQRRFGASVGAGLVWRF